MEWLLGWRLLDQAFPGRWIEYLRFHVSISNGFLISQFSILNICILGSIGLVDETSQS
jgi:hypothetical protein